VDLNSSQEQESVYNLLLNLQAEILQRMKDGAVARDLYQHALSYVKKNKPDLEKNFVKNVGFGVSHISCCPDDS
jgi:nucleosome binding factor SPN SPT16 subunit